MAKGRKFADISKETEKLRNERLPHLTTEKSGKSEDDKPPLEVQDDETIIKENTEEIQHNNASSASDEKVSTPNEKKEEIIFESTPILNEKNSIEKKPKKEDRKREEEAVRGENAFTENIRISQYWNQVLAIIQKNNKGQYKSKEVILDIIISKGIKGIIGSEEIMMFVSSLNKKRET